MIIKKIIDTFHDLSREHVLVRSFVYNRLQKGMGVGEQNYPLVFLEDPIYLNRVRPLDGKVVSQVNFDVVMLPQAFANYNVKQLTEAECQAVAHDIALNFIAYLRELGKDYDTRTGIDIVDFSFMTLRNWGDDNAAGVRCSLYISVDNDIQLCDLEEHFDEDKEFDIEPLLDDFNLDDAQGCEVFDWKLPKFSTKMQ